MLTGPSVKSVLEIIFEWSQRRPTWQQDALRRIMSKSSLDAADVAELVSLCKRDNGAKGVELLPIPLTQSDLPANPGAGDAVTLLSLSDVVGANQLAPGQKITFEPSGLTIVYGDNGTGKSGYARILKKACRARFPGEIMPNALDSQSATQQARALMEYAIGGSVSPSLPWIDDGRGPHELLSAISVFDRESGTVHLRGKNEVAYRPFGLDIPDELAGVCQEIKTALSAEQSALQKLRDPVFLKPTWKSATAAGCILSNLKGNTVLDELNALAVVKDEERERHRQLNADLVKDPMKASAEQKLLAESLKRLATALRQVGDENADSPLRLLKDLAVDARSKRAAAQLAVDGAFGGAAVAGVGGGTWRALWEAARRYSEQAAYVGQPFPPTAEDLLCVLCHQPLTAGARSRLAGFENFIRGDTEQQATRAEAAYDAALKRFQGKPVRTFLYRDARRQAALRDHALGKAILRFFASARLRRRICEISLAVDDPLELPALAPNPEAGVLNLEEMIRRYALELNQAADVEGRKRLETERDELSDRIALEFLAPKAKAEVERLQTLFLIEACLGQTNTTAITKLGNDIADKVITPKIRDQFHNEIAGLAAEKVRVEIVRSGGRYGSPQYEVRLSVNPSAKVHLILSEGEQTCVALAAFMTELATAAHKSALIFDDPVSSLDHRWRRKVAERLVAETSTRQIIVFTHDLVFVNDLKDMCEDGNVPLKVMTVSRTLAGAGVVSAGLPWEGKGVKDRVDKLEKDVREAQKFYENNDEESYKERIFQIYSRLRSTWERAIEDTAFSGVVVRHRDYVNTKNLRKTIVLTAADCDSFEAGFKKCCDQTDAHDHSRGRNAAPPPPNEVMQDVQTVRAWADFIRQRQNAIKS